MPYRKMREGGRVSRRAILEAIRRVADDPELADMNLNQEELLVIAVLEQQEEIARVIFERMQQFVEDDPRMGFVYKYLRTKWQTDNEFDKLFGAFIQEEQKKKKRG